MQLKRALELCQLPLDQSRSHEIRVDRYAMIHVLAEYRRGNTQIKGLETELTLRLDTIKNLETEVDRGNARIKELEAGIETQYAKYRQLEETVSAGALS